MIVSRRDREDIQICSTCHIPVDLIDCPICEGAGVQMTKITCATCGGTGEVGADACMDCLATGNQNAEEMCVVCYGNGTVKSCPQCDAQIFDETLSRKMIRLRERRKAHLPPSACPDCDGRGRVRTKRLLEKPCRTCGGTGTIDDLAQH
jgi:DnaJ-class molecular chaperone